MIPIQNPKPTWQEIISGREVMMVISPSQWLRLMPMKLGFVAFNGGNAEIAHSL